MSGEAPQVNHADHLACAINMAAGSASDRHDSRCQPAQHHTNLNFDADFALNDFLYDTCDYQRAVALRRPFNG